MICRDCGGACSEEMRLCPNCGAALQQGAPPAAAVAVGEAADTAKKSRLSVFLTGLGLYLIVAAAVFAVVGFVTGSPAENRYLLVGGQDGALHLLTPAGQVLALPGEGENLAGAAQTAQISADGGAMAFLLRSGDSELGALYIAARGEIRAPLQQEVSAFLLADGGEHLLFAADLQNDTGALYLWTARDGSVRRLASDAVVLHSGGRIRSAAIAAGGGRVAYVAGNPGVQPLQLSAYSWSEGKPPEMLGENILPLALADRGNPLLYAATNPLASAYGCYVRTDGEDRKLFAEQDFPNLVAAVAVSPGFGDVFYNTPEGFFRWQPKSGVLRLADQSVPLQDGGECTGLRPADAPAFLLQGDGTLLHTAQGKVAAGVRGAAAGSAGVCYETEHGLFYWRQTSWGPTVVDVAQNTGWFDLPAGEDRIYFTESDNSLYAVQPGNSPQLVAHQVGAVALQPRADRLYFIRQDGSLYCAERGEAPLLLLEGVRAPIACLQP